MSRVCVIGAGLGGLALAIRLQSAGIATTLVEARDAPGGRAGALRHGDFTFDAVPGLVVDPEALAELWALSGGAIADDVTLLPISPLCRHHWPDGTTFDRLADRVAQDREVIRVAPGDLAGYHEFADYAERAYVEGHVRLGTTPMLDLSSMARAVPALARLQAWRSLYAVTGAYLTAGKLREAFSVSALSFGGNPMDTSALHALEHKRESDGGVWWPQGGMNRLAAAMTALFERAGGIVRLHDPVAHVHVLGDRVNEVECASGWREQFDAVASNADIVHTYRTLLSGTPRGADMARKLARRRYSQGVFVCHFILQGSWPGIAHRTVLFGPRFDGLLDDIFEHGVLPRDMLIDLHHPSVTDPSLAPAGQSVFQAAIPVANLAKLPIDWEQVGPVIERRVLDEVGRRLIPDIHDRVVTCFHTTPRDHALDFSAWAGAAHSIASTRGQGGWFRGHNRDDKLANFYLVGAGVHPGGGLPGVIAGARIAAKLMLEDLSR